ncbi:MAG: SRPBCC family protein [Candidatus Dormibacterales bacterium]
MANQYSVNLTIGAPPQRVWDLLVDAPGYKRWNPSVVTIDGSIEAGRTIKLVSAVNPGRTFVLKVTAMDPPRRMVWSGGMPLGLFTGTRTFAIVVAGAGCHFSMSEDYTGLMSGLIFKSIPDLNASFKQFAESLKAAAERPA